MNYRSADISTKNLRWLFGQTTPSPSEGEQDGLIGIITGIFEVTSAGISAAIVFGFFAAVLFRPRG